MAEVSTIGLDIAKAVFHAHGADARGQMVFSRRLTRAKLLEFFAAQPRCVVALEACGGAHHWAREIGSLGHDVNLIPPAYVKPFVKRNKNDAVDAEAICEAAQRPSMRYAAIKTEAQQAAGMVFRTRDLLVRQRTQLINAIRGHLTEFGWVAPKGPSHVSVLASMLEEDEEIGSSLPDAARAMFLVMTGQLEQLNEQVALLDKEIARRAREDEAARRLMTIPGIGPIAATALLALAPPVEGFARGRDFAAWLGLTPRQHSTGGKERLGAISRMGERTLRRLLIIGSSAVVLHASKRGAPRGSSAPLRRRTSSSRLGSDKQDACALSRRLDGSTGGVCRPSSLGMKDLDSGRPLRMPRERWSRCATTSRATGCRFFPATSRRQSPSVS